MFAYIIEVDKKLKFVRGNCLFPYSYRRLCLQNGCRGPPRGFEIIVIIIKSKITQHNLIIYCVMILDTFAVFHNAL